MTNKDLKQYLEDTRRKRNDVVNLYYEGIDGLKQQSRHAKKIHKLENLIMEFGPAEPYLTDKGEPTFVGPADQPVICALLDRDAKLHPFFKNRKDALASFDSDLNFLTIWEPPKNSDTKLLAALLLHELMHFQQTKSRGRAANDSERLVDEYDTYLFQAKLLENSFGLSFKALLDEVKPLVAEWIKNNFETEFRFPSRHLKQFLGNSKINNYEGSIALAPLVVLAADQVCLESFNKAPDSETKEEFMTMLGQY